MSHPAPLIDDTYRERLNLNVYDSISLPEIRASAYRLFGASNIGNLEFTNLAVPRCLMPDDSTAVLQNWYARVSHVNDLVLGTPDSIRRSEARAEWVESTIATLVMGVMPVAQLPLSDLLRRRQGQRDESMEHEPSVEILAERAFEVLKLSVQWDQLPDEERRRIVSATKFVRSQLRAPVLAVVPQRQTVHVTLETNMELLGRVIDTSPSEAIRVWVHLEGILCRDTGIVFSKS